LIQKEQVAGIARLGGWDHSSLTGLFLGFLPKFPGMGFLFPGWLLVGKEGKGGFFPGGRFGPLGERGP